MAEDVNDALSMMRRALELIDRNGDPWMAGPHLAEAIDRLTSGHAGAVGNDNFEGHGEGDDNPRVPPVI